MILRLSICVALCIPATSALGASNPCDHEAVPSKARGICTAYVQGQRCYTSIPSDHPRCLALEKNFKRIAGLPITRALAYTGISQTIPASGGKVELPGIATVTFPEGSFPSDTTVRVFLTSDQNVIDVYTEDAAQLDLPPLIQHQIRVDVGEAPISVPFKPVQVDILLATALTGFLNGTNSYSPIFLEEVGSPEEYPLVTFSAQYSNVSAGGESSYLSLNVPTAGFINTPEITNSSYQAVISLMVIHSK